MSLQRGDVVLIDYPYAVGAGSKVRPVVIIQNDRDNQRLPTTIIAQITSNIARASKVPTQLLIDTSTSEGSLSGLLRPSAVNCANLFTIDQQNILRHLGKLGPALLLRLDDCLRAALELP
jgi:mRNA interferase MazF